MTSSPQEPAANTISCEVMQILSSKWAFLIITFLDERPLRFRQLQRKAAIITTQSLTNSLRHLEQIGVVKRKVIPTVPITVEYSLTEKGKDFHLSVKEMAKWEVKWGKGRPVYPG
ncbi:HxlR family transcriptional regulator [Reticulibacter mediterranei]|uniref:HxlR family transcriptional regulator n=1 Tax=Reticulibacter mediterranei TaxID=2778369 RepID=A0A8J3MZL0_9CHLR|nr:helix-turn-helix domain-containing protein [Reticulibacter mediterranei]GHO92017.1 HxlR family transcriptional regulator [Reticulibacter mediterranei]